MKISPRGQKSSASTGSQCLCGCTHFWPLEHSILTPGSTLFWLPAALDFDPQGLFQNWKKNINHIFKRGSPLILVCWLGEWHYLCVFSKFIYFKNWFFCQTSPVHIVCFFQGKGGGGRGWADQDARKLDEQKD